MKDTSDLAVEGEHILQSLLNEIDVAETELKNLRSELDRSEEENDSAKLRIQARSVIEETKSMKQYTPEGLGDDEGVQYYVAVGMLEQQIQELKEIKEMADRNLENNNLILEHLRSEISKQETLVEKLEQTVEERRNEARSDEGKSALRSSEEGQLRATKMATSEIKGYLVKYVEKIGSQEKGFNDGDKSPMGPLLQSLWEEFQTRDVEGWINIEDLDFDVRPEDVHKLRVCEIIKCKPDNANMIQFVDFTMRS